MNKIINLIIGTICIFLFGYGKGKSSEKIKQLKRGVKYAIKTKRRRNKRRKDSINTVRDRLRKDSIK